MKKRPGVPDEEVSQGQPVPAPRRRSNQAASAAAPADARAVTATDVSSPQRRHPRNGRPARDAQPEKPRGRDEIIESVIDATLSLWACEGPAALSLRGIADRAGVNYGLVYRHFGTKHAVIQAAMNRRLEDGLESIENCNDLMEVMDVFLDRGAGSARLLAWATLQYSLREVMPPQDLVLKRVRELAGAEIPGEDAADSSRSAVLVGSLIAMVYGWRLFEPYLVPELGLEGLSKSERDSLIRDLMVSMVEAQAEKSPQGARSGNRG